MLFGTTGTGKSTLANSIIQGKDAIYRDKDGFYQVRQALQYAKETVFKIGHEVKSETRAPKFFKHKEKGIYLVDGPGINDSNLRNEYANQTAIK
jgi:predicted GTPase